MEKVFRLSGSLDMNDVKCEDAMRYDDAVALFFEVPTSAAEKARQKKINNSLIYRGR